MKRVNLGMIKFLETKITKKKSIFFFQIDFLTIRNVLYFFYLSLDKPVSLREVNRSQTSKFLYGFFLSGLAIDPSL